MTNIVSIRRATPTRMAWIDSPLVCLTSAAAALWRHWLGQHGLDPDLICLDQAIVVNDDECTISLRVWEEMTSSDGSLPTRLEVTVQLATPALPFPEETGYATWTCALDEDDDYLDQNYLDQNYLDQNYLGEDCRGADCRGADVRFPVAA